MGRRPLSQYIRREVVRSELMGQETGIVFGDWPLQYGQYAGSVFPATASPIESCSQKRTSF